MKKTIIFGIMLAMMIGVVSAAYTEDFNTGTCPNWLDALETGVDCSNFNLQAGFASLDVSQSIITDLTSPVYIEFDTDLLVGQDSDIMVVLTGENVTGGNDVGIHIADYENNFAGFWLYVDNDLYECPQEYYATGPVHVKAVMLPNGTIETYADGTLMCSHQFTFTNINHSFVAISTVGFSAPSYIDNFYIDNVPYAVPTPEPTPEVEPRRRGGNNAAYIVQQNLVKQAEATTPKPTNIFDAIIQVIMNIRKALGLEG